mmetsp:Transcript_83441/g.232742  ORF Transcript_83441/g.232742 Transcript_83441/m.232742 type:complete len:230 (+) Transcript_83441:21-710(+)
MITRTSAPTFQALLRMRAHASNDVSPSIASHVMRAEAIHLPFFFLIPASSSSCFFSTRSCSIPDNCSNARFNNGVEISSRSASSITRLYSSWNASNCSVSKHHGGRFSFPAMSLNDVIPLSGIASSIQRWTSRSHFCFAMSLAALPRSSGLAPSLSAADRSSVSMVICPTVVFWVPSNARMRDASVTSLRSSPFAETKRASSTPFSKESAMASSNTSFSSLKPSNDSRV